MERLPKSARISYKNWTKRIIDGLMVIITTTVSTERHKGRGRPKTVITDDKIDEVEDRICLQEDNPGAREYQFKVAKRLKCSQSSVH